MVLDIILLREAAAAALLFFITRFFIRSLIQKSCRWWQPLPPGPKGWPLIGALPLLGTMPHVTLAKMAKKYGPVMYLKMGTCDMVVASTPDAARAFLKTLDLNFSNRPPNAGATHLAYNAQDMVFAHYGPRWKLLRKLSNLHMLGGKALQDWSQVRVVELGHMLRAMCDSSRKGEPVVVPEMLTYAMANMIGQVILSRRVFVTKGSESNEFKDMVVELMTSAGFFNIGDFIPSIAWMDLQGIERGMKKLHNKFDVVITKMIKEHMASTHERKGKLDFLDVVMANREISDSEKLTITNIKALLLSTGGNVALDTTQYRAPLQSPVSHFPLPFAIGSCPYAACAAEVRVGVENPLMTRFEFPATTRHSGCPNRVAAVVLYIKIDCMDGVQFETNNKYNEGGKIEIFERNQPHIWEEKEIWN
ncbi:hypothetical protein LWI29_004708 [Acer saccharum]|uniref:Flavonoid 3',5'-hydroxylase n=1 Tax=Acer saccharum TaxID=4024 RepID=A0AA39RQL7_ACESA|nr:hypothetical protein LWI29_004708 [Acer saccharum]